MSATPTLTGDPCYRGPAWRCGGTRTLRYGATPAGMQKPPVGQRSACTGCCDCRRVVVR